MGQEALSGGVMGDAFLTGGGGGADMGLGTEEAVWNIQWKSYYLWLQN